MLQKRKTITMAMRMMAKLISLLVVVLDRKWANLCGSYIVCCVNLNKNMLPDFLVYFAVKDNESNYRKKAGEDESEPVDVEPEKDELENNPDEPSNT